MKDKAKDAAKEHTALEPLGGSRNATRRRGFGSEDAEESSFALCALLRVSAHPTIPATQRERAIVDKTAQGGHLPATTEVCKIAKGLKSFMQQHGTWIQSSVSECRLLYATTCLQ